MSSLAHDHRFGHILLAEELDADGLLIDDRDGRREAKRRELRLIGTLGVLAAGAEKGLLNVVSSIGD